MSIIDPTEYPNQTQWQQHNQTAWDDLSNNNHPLTHPAEDTLFENPLRCVDPLGWLGSSIQGWRVLCLAAGGGRHGPLYAAAGAVVTVVDLSAGMLQLDREVALKRKLDLTAVQCSMDDLSIFDTGEFDLVVHPVSTCYVPDIRPVYRQVANVLRAGGLYVSQHKQPTNLQTDLEPHGEGYVIAHHYYRDEHLPDFVGKSALRETGTREYLHRWEQLIGWMCHCGFVIEDLVEPMHARSGAEPGTRGHRSQFVAPYVRIKARRADEANENASLFYR